MASIARKQGAGIEMCFNWLWDAHRQGSGYTKENAGHWIELRRLLEMHGIKVSLAKELQAEFTNTDEPYVEPDLER